MGTSGHELDHLLENAGWVRALGVELVGAVEADDLVQDAWVAALERPGAARNPAAWLSGVVRRLAGRRRRGEERRVRRERASARADAQPGADELVAEAELQRRLILAVMELDEPQRATVLLRFYRGWTPEEIARSQGVPAATVRTRLHRALARLRERLDHEHGGRAAWAFAFAMPGSATTSATITGGALMGAKAIAATVVIAALAGWAIWRGRGDPEDGSARRGQDVAAAEAVPAGASALPPDAARPAEERAQRERLVPAGSATLAASELLLYGTVVDPEGEPVELESLALETDGRSVREASRPSAGSYSIAGVAPGRYTLVARSGGFVTRNEDLVLTGEREHERHDLVLAPALSIPVKVLGPSGTLLAGWRLVEDGVEYDVVVTEEAPGDGLLGLNGPARSASLADFIGAGDPEHRVRPPAGTSGVLRLRTAPPVYVSLIAHDATLVTRRVDGPLDELVLAVDPTKLANRLGALRARFVDASSGQAIAGGNVRFTSGSTAGVGATSDGSGAVSLPRLAPGLYGLEFTHADHARLVRSVRIPDGGDLDLGDVPVWRKATIRGKVVDERGRPVTALLRWVAREGPRAPVDTETGMAYWLSGGEIDIDDVARGSVTLFVEQRDHAVLCRELDTSSGLVESLELRLERGVPVSVRAPIGNTALQFTLATEGGVPFATWTSSCAIYLTQLAPGRYQIWSGVSERVEHVEEFVVGIAPVEFDVGSTR